jgi:hypothetical protein
MKARVDWTQQGITHGAFSETIGLGHIVIVVLINVSALLLNGRGYV